LNAAISLRNVPVDVTLIDRRNFHLFQPLLYQVATGGLSPANIAAPLRSVLSRQRNARVLLGEVIDIDAAGKAVVLADDRIPYDTLVVGAGMTHSYFGHTDWERLAPGLKTVEDATSIRRRLLRAFEDAERCDDPARAAALMTFVVIGAGPTGIEMAGAISDLARQTLRHDFRRIDPAKARIVLIEGADRVLPPFRSAISAKAAQSLARLGVEVWTEARVTDIRPDSVTVHRDGGDVVLPSHNVIWAAGVQAVALSKKIALATGAQTDRAGRIAVQPDLTIAGHPEILVIGDMASAKWSRPGVAEPATLPGMAPVAIQQGRYVGDAIRRRLRGEPIAPFRYRDKGSMATIGRNAAVADLNWTWFSGYIAWLIWLFVHILYLIRFENRALVLFQWAWNYFTRNRTARLITGDEDETVVSARG
jgi:NADH dehydrogenase